MGGSKDTIYAQLLALPWRQGDVDAFEHLAPLWEARHARETAYRSAAIGAGA